MFLYRLAIEELYKWKKSANRKPLIIGIILGCICFFIGIYIIFVELPYRKKRAAYLAKRRNGRR